MKIKHYRERIKRESYGLACTSELASTTAETVGKVPCSLPYRPVHETSEVVAWVKLLLALCLEWTIVRT